MAFRVGVVSIYENPAFPHKVAEDLAKSANKACQVTAEPAKGRQKLAQAALKVLRSLHFDRIFDDFSSLLPGIIEKVVR